jgi:hypothetical protein
MALPNSTFIQMLIGTNQPALEDLDIWIFHPGMLFKSLDKWWGDFGTREFPHEGIDLCLYKNRSGQMHKLSPETQIPVIFDGVVRAMFKDYLGQAIIVEHYADNIAKGKFLTVYAHTKPQEEVQPGAQVKKGDIIATIADTKHSKARILPHLHLSLAIPAPDLSYENFVWNIMRDPARITLIGPLNLIKADYHVPDEDGLNQQIVDSHSIRS